MRKLYSALGLLLLLATALPAFAAEPAYNNFTFGLRGGAMAFSAETNLAEGSTVSVWIHQTKPQPKALYSAVPLDYPENMDLTVKDGTIIGVFPSTKEYGLPKGKYELVFTAPATGTNTQSHRLRITMPEDIPAQGWEEPKGDWK